MSDLISISEVIDIMCNLRIDNVAVNGKRVTEYIKELPTVKAKPVVHGEWIEDQVETGDPFGNGYYLIDMLRCSVCGAFFDVSETRNFCPECGADMRKKVE